MKYPTLGRVVCRAVILLHLEDAVGRSVGIIQALRAARHYELIPRLSGRRWGNLPNLIVVSAIRDARRLQDFFAGSHIRCSHGHAHLTVDVNDLEDACGSGLSRRRLIAGVHWLQGPLLAQVSRRADVRFKGRPGDVAVLIDTDADRVIDRELYLINIAVTLRGGEL